MTTSRTPARMFCILAFLVCLFLIGRGLTAATTVVGDFPRVMPRGRAADAELPETPNAHARIKHPDAQFALDWVRNNGLYCRYDCTDGRTRFVCEIDRQNGDPRRWAIVVLATESWELITSFTTTDDVYVENVIRQCGTHPTLHNGHP